MLSSISRGVVATMILRTTRSTLSSPMSLRTFKKLLATVDLTCCSRCRDYSTALPRCFGGETPNGRKILSASSLRTPIGVGIRHHFLPPGCLAPTCGKQADEHHVLLTASASNHRDEHDAVPTCNASNTQPFQPGLKAPAARDDPSGRGLFQGAPGGDSEQATALTRYINPSSAQLEHRAANKASKLTPEYGASTTRAARFLLPRSTPPWQTVP